MSTTTGIVACSTTSAKVSSPALTAQDSGWWQLPQRGVPDAATGTRLRCPQCGQVMIASAIRGTTFLVRDGEVAADQADPDLRTVAHIAGEQCAADPGLDLAGDEPA
jgi:hypothetical protein